MVEVQNILVCKEHKEVLGISRNASRMEIKNAYKTLARRFHPDKNPTPGAADAFKHIGNAFDALMKQSYSTSSTSTT